jgi:hypothetical protein
MGLPFFSTKPLLPFYFTIEINAAVCTSIHIIAQDKVTFNYFTRTPGA